MNEKVPKEEDSMEDILHSIRDIVSSEDDNPGDTMAKNSETPQAAEVEEDVLELTEMVVEENSKPPEAATPEVKTPPPAETKEPAKTEQPAQKVEKPMADTPADAAKKPATGDVLENIDQALGKEAAPAAEAPKAAPVAAPAPVTAAAAPAQPTKPAAAKESLVSEKVAQETTGKIKELVDRIPQKEIDSPTMRTVEDLVVESLKPMLSEWLNQNLPTVVRQIVEKEVRKILPRE